MSARIIATMSLIKSADKSTTLPPWSVVAQRVLEDLRVAGYCILGPGELDPDTIERCAEVADAADIEWNAVAYDRRQSGRDDNFACASASSATKIAALIRNLKGNGNG